LIVRRAAAPSEGRAVQKEPVEYGGTTREALKHRRPSAAKGGFVPPLALKRSESRR
jgi:hypothetical protein